MLQKFLFSVTKLQDVKNNTALVINSVFGTEIDVFVLSSGMSSFLCKFLKKYFGEGYLPSLESVRFYKLLC